jgi:hypothetical protein
VRGGLDHKRYRFDTYEFRRVNQNDTIFAPAAGTSVASLSTMLSGFGKGLNLPAGTVTLGHPQPQCHRPAYDIYCNCIKSGPAGGPGDFTLSSTTNGNARGNNRKVTETDTGGFLMADFDTRLAGCPPAWQRRRALRAETKRWPPATRPPAVARKSRWTTAIPTRCHRSTWLPTWPRTWCCGWARPR